MAVDVAGNNKMPWGLYVKCRIFLTKQGLSFFADFHGSLNIKFHGTPSSWSRTKTYRQTDKQTDTTVLIGAIRGYTIVP
jgi:hypothetical protein